jgi:hypothetical protein
VVLGEVLAAEAYVRRCLRKSVAAHLEGSLIDKPLQAR